MEEKLDAHLRSFLQTLPVEFKTDDLMERLVKRTDNEIKKFIWDVGSLLVRLTFVEDGVRIGLKREVAEYNLDYPTRRLKELTKGI